jgi:hypothetical protein
MCFVNIEEVLKCEEHEAPYLICVLKSKKEKDTVSCEITAICPVDQQMATRPLSIPLGEIEKWNFPLADKIFRCEKCFREATIQDTAIGKRSVIIYLSCPEHGFLIERDISIELYDGIRFAWDTKDLKEEKSYTV